MNMETMRKTAIERPLDYKSQSKKAAIKQQQARNESDETMGALHHLIIRSNLDEDLSFDEHQNQIAELQDYVNYHDPRLAIDAFIWMVEAVENGHMDSIIEVVNRVLTQAKEEGFVEFGLGEDYHIHSYKLIAEKMAMFKNLITSESAIEDDSKVVDLRKVSGINC